MLSSRKQWLSESAATRTSQRTPAWSGEGKRSDAVAVKLVETLSEAQCARIQVFEILVFAFEIHDRPHHTTLWQRGNLKFRVMRVNHQAAERPTHARFLKKQPITHQTENQPGECDEMVSDGVCCELESNPAPRGERSEPNR